MVVQQWRCRPTPKRKSLRQIVAERRKGQAPKKSKVAPGGFPLLGTVLTFVAKAEPEEQDNEDGPAGRQGHSSWRSFSLHNLTVC